MATNYNISTYYQSWGLDPVAQTFIIDRTNYPSGIFLKSIKLFFKSKPTDSNVPVKLSIVGTLNGYPNGETLDYSQVTKPASEIKVSDNPHYLDPNSFTEFVFEAPVYVQSGVLYAFLLQTSGGEYDVYIAAQNATALPSSTKNNFTDPTPTTITKIGTAPYIGSIFESQNAITWTADQGKSIMFVMERCVFDIAKTPKLPFVVPAGLSGKKLISDDIDRFYDANNVSTVLKSGTDIESHAFNLTTTDFIPTNTNIEYSYKALVSATNIYSKESSVIPGKFACPTYDDIYLNDNLGPRKLVANSDLSFLMYSTLSSQDDTVSPIIADDGITLYNTRWNINNLGITNSTFTLVSGGTGYSGSTTIDVSPPNEAGGVQAVLTPIITNKVITGITITTEGSGYTTTPTITVVDDATRSGNVDAVILVNGETSPFGGNALCRYITKKVVLTPGNESGDLRVFVTAYRPQGTNVYVYYKLLNKNDTQPFDSGYWQLMTMVGNNQVFSKTMTDLYEYELAPGSLGSATNSVSYDSLSGQSYDTFNQFAIKIVLTTDDKTKVPFLTDMRVIALPTGA